MSEEYKCAPEMFEAVSVVIRICGCGCGHVKIYLLDDDDVIQASAAVSDKAIDDLKKVSQGERVVNPRTH